jgi:hypothetical protein
MGLQQHSRNPRLQPRDGCIQRIAKGNIALVHAHRD